MTTSNSILSGIQSLYLWNTIRTTSYAPFNYDNNDVFNFFLKSRSLGGNTVETPMYNMQKIMSLYIEDGDLVGQDFVTPIIKHFATSTFKTAEKAIYSICSITSNYIRPFTVKDCMYYGFPGMILNSEFRALLLNTAILQEGVFKKLITYIHPSVFYTDNPVEKVLAKKYIPRILEFGVTVAQYAWACIIPEIRILDVTDEFLVKPEIECNSSIINQTLFNNLHVLENHESARLL